MLRRIHRGDLFISNKPGKQLGTSQQWLEKSSILINVVGSVKLGGARVKYFHLRLEHFVQLGLG